MMSRAQKAFGLRSRVAGGHRQTGGSRVDLCVVHLVRRANPLDAFKRFLDSYRRHPTGAPHRLAVLLKGFDDEAAAEPYRALGADVCDHWLEMPDEGFDLGAYRHAATWAALAVTAADGTESVQAGQDAPRPSDELRLFDPALRPAPVSPPADVPIDVKCGVG